MALGASDPHRVVIIGAGFGGLFAAKALRRAPVAVTLIDRTGFHVFQPLLYQVATGILSQGEIAPAVREVLRSQRNVRAILGDVTHIDLQARTVTSRTSGGLTVTPYDSLIVAAGSGQSYFGHDEFAKAAPGMKSVEDALALRGRIFGAFELAELEPDPERRRARLTFVVVGGGPTGVELAGQIAELSRRALRGNFRSFDPAMARVVLVESSAAILEHFGANLSTRAAATLERLGVEVRVDSTVVGVNEHQVTIKSTDGSRQHIDGDTVIWAAGVSASPLGAKIAGACGADIDRAGRVATLPDCTVPGHPEVFVVGDMVAMDGGNPGVAQVAIQSGRYAAHTIHARLGGRRAPEPAFRYRDKGSMATVSRFHAVASIGPLCLSGFAAWVVWLVVHLLYLVAFKNRVTVLLHWAVSFIGRSRSERTATFTAPTTPVETQTGVVDHGHVQRAGLRG